MKKHDVLRSTGPGLLIALASRRAAPWLGAFERSGSLPDGRMAARVEVNGSEHAPRDSRCKIDGPTGALGSLKAAGPAAGVTQPASALTLHQH